MVALNITSEIGLLKTVVLKRPGKELENIIPQNVERLLFDNIPYLRGVQKEHDIFATVLRDHGVEVLYLDQLIEETLSIKHVKESFISQFLLESKAPFDDNMIGQRINDYLLSLSVHELVKSLMFGIRKEEIMNEKKSHLHEYIEDAFPFYIPPQPNLYYMRDPAFVIGNGITLHNMKDQNRQRESMFFQAILKFHPQFSKQEISIWLDRDYPFSLEGGDILILNKETIVIGISERTSAKAIEQLSVNLFKQRSGFKRIIAIIVPKSRTYMHLDTIFTMVDQNKFCIDPIVLTEKVYTMEVVTGSTEVKVAEENDLESTLKRVLNIDEIVFIYCGGGDKIATSREQGNDATNTLAISPGVVVTYDRNEITNHLLRQNGVKVLEIPSSELSRGGGGPRCMSMPLVRRDL